MGTSQAVAGVGVRDGDDEKADTGQQKDGVEHGEPRIAARNVIAAAYRFERAQWGAEI
jgi:hypothetical protein